MKKILGLDLGTNSIGWALVEQNYEAKEGKILGLGSRIIPMPQDVLGSFAEGASISQTAERTRMRNMRRLRERHLLRRERIHRVLHLLGFLPKHYADKIDFEKRLGQFLPETESKFAYDADGQFIFESSFKKMLAEFRTHQPELLNRKNKKGKDAKIPRDWTIYYLRKEALTRKIEHEELAWLLLHFNQKRGYYQLRGEEGDEKPNKIEAFHSFTVVEVTADEPQKGKTDIWYNITLENGWIYRRSSKLPLYDWKGKTRDFIVTTDINEDGTIKKDKEGKEIRSFRSPKEDDWKLQKKKTEADIENSGKTVGSYIYDSLLHNPRQKIRGKLVRTIERKYYKEELRQILEKQIGLTPALQNKALYQQCVETLYPHNLNHQSTLAHKNFLHLFIDDILFYQRPLRSQKSSISNCPLETRTFIHDGVKKTESLKCIPKSHPLYQEFRLWQWVGNLRIINKDDDTNETARFLQSPTDVEALFAFLNNRKEIEQKHLLKYFKVKDSSYRWNYVEDKAYPCNETGSMIAGRLEKVADVPEGFLTKDSEEALWHIIYSVTDKIDYEKALRSFANKNHIDVESFYEAFRKFPPFPSQYGAYSAKAIKKLLPLMRVGAYWSDGAIDDTTKSRINNIISGEYDEAIRDRVRDKAIALTEASNFQSLPEWLAKYIVYDRHAERGDAGKWKSVADMDVYLQQFRQHSLKNPIVEQILMEALRTIRDIWNHYGNGAENYFDEIHIELGREMKNPKEKREQLTKQISINENTNLRIKALLAEMINDGAVENVRPYSPMQQEILKLYEDAVLNSDVEIPDDILKISKLPQPSSSELQRYKLWLEQKYRSPYTGLVIPLNKLFTPMYEIEHIIPQKRFFDDSLSNKVICEAAVNTLKDNQTALEFIQENGGRHIELGMGKQATIFTEKEYSAFVQQHYANNRTKKVKLTTLDIPEKMIERQLNDTRYISKFIMGVLSNIVRAEKNDDGVNSKNILATNGQITSRLRQDWGLDAIWNELVLPRFDRLNTIINTTHFTTYNERYQKYLPAMPLELQKGFQKKRIDHRHHALDALVVACATRNHINFLNNQHALDKRKSKEEKQKDRYDLNVILCDKKYNDDSKDNYKWMFKQPWASFVPDVKENLEKIIVSFKQNLRIINKPVNNYQIINNGEKQLIKQTKGMNWAIRKSLHSPMPYGKRTYAFDKLKISENVGKWNLIIDLSIRAKVQQVLNDFKNKVGDTQKFLKANPLKDFEGKNILITDFKIKNEKFRRRQPVSKLSNRGNGGIKTGEDAIKFINKIVDKNLRNDLLSHLRTNENDIDKAFSADGIERFNSDRKIPVYKIPIAEAGSGRFAVGENYNTKHKWVEADTGTNLFFAIYKDENGKRTFETIPLNVVVERQKQGLPPVPEKNDNQYNLLFHLSPNDLVFIPDDNISNNSIDKELLQINAGRIYRFVSCTGSEGHFVQNNYAISIVNNEQGTNNKSERMLDYKNLPALTDEKGKPHMIKNICWKIPIDRLGKIKSIIK